MVSTTPETLMRPWAKALATAAKEFLPTPLSVLSGSLPAGLQGTLYRNGPARLERGGKLVGHWFDGDGAVLRVHFSAAGATGVYRYVQTAGYQEEEKAGQFIFGNYGMTPTAPIWQRFGKTVKNAANTSVLALPDKLLALWEGGQPHALDLETLETRGIDHLGGLGNHRSYSAHPKCDAKTGKIYNFGVTISKQATLHVYRSNAGGQIEQQTVIALDGIPIIHDFVMAGQYLLFFISPVRMDPLPVLLTLKSYSDSLRWQPEKATQILVIDRETLAVVSRSEADPWYQWHFGNGYVDARGTVVVDLVRYENFQTNQYLKEVATGQTHTAAKGTLWQLHLDPLSGKLHQMQQVVDRGCEFPVVSPQQVGQPARYTYLSIHRQDADLSQELFGAIACFDYQTGSLTEADLGEHRYPMEPLYAPDAYDPEQGWIVTVVFDGKTSSSEVWIFDADHLDADPVCRLALPEVVPMGFHGTWKPA